MLLELLIMRVIHVIECFASGAALFVNFLTRFTNGFEHIVIHGEKPDEISAEEVKATFPEDVKFIYWNYSQREINPYQDIRALIELLKIFRKHKGDVIHLHSSKAGFLGRVASTLTKHRNVVYTPHGASFARKDISSFQKNLFIWLEKTASLFSGNIVCCSSSEADIFNQVGIKATYINNGTVLDNCENTTLTKNQSKFTIVTCGRVTGQKNPQLFNSIAERFAENSKFQFIWVGDGTTANLDLLQSPNIIVTGMVSKKEVFEIVGSADLYISTALWEGLPLAVLEAMSVSKCLLLNKCVGNIDLVKDGFNGFKFKTIEKAVEKILWLEKTPLEVERMGNNSRKWCEEDFNIKTNAHMYQELYKLHLQHK
ncbi:glycosyltransferase family 4 protein [Pontibacter qinzhouensis]|uniref:Glycosyltransferase family 4 protein n=1 Tax=Pontibacter qinzhouensis TaxID=2603253 RepID=A0A5C8K3R6_9BACT|nr:glycosyltransferase [Pontibacter qinzhouensis]TXK44900.1 glycosyltransferase family 4 protein [Pontibacter qinzhouensis]